MSERAKRFAQMLPTVENPPPPDVMALGHMMRDWLEAVVADAGTSVDCGGGFECYDLWLKMGGKEVYITLKLRDLSE